MEGSGSKPRVFIHSDVAFSGTPLSAIAASCGCEAVVSCGELPVCESLDDVAPPLALIVLSIGDGITDTLAALGEMRRKEWLHAIPVLVVAQVAESELDLWQLRALGVVGVVDSDAGSGHVAFRLGRIVYSGAGQRRFTRVPCQIPVDLSIDGRRSKVETTSLSAGGVGLLCSKAIQPNTLLTLRLCLPEEGEPIVVGGRTVSLRKSDRGSDHYEVGVFFFGASHELRTRLHRVVDQLLTVWDNAAGPNLERIVGSKDDVVEAGAGSAPGI